MEQENKPARNFFRGPVSQEELKVQRNLSLLLSAVLVVLVTILGVGNYVDRLAADENNEDVYKGVRLLGDVAQLIRKYYVTANCTSTPPRGCSRDRTGSRRLFPRMNCRISGSTSKAPSAASALS